MAALIKETIGFYNVYIVGKSDPRSRDWFLMDSFAYPFIILFLYFNFVLSWGPRFMINREPFKLNLILRLYNTIQILLNIYVLERCLTLGWFGRYRLLCEPVDWSESDHALEIARGVWVFFMIKFTDLLDTVFFVLRKRDRQVSFLHLYHHAGMFFMSYCSVKYAPGGHFTFVGLVNSIVHIIMYAYYLLVNIRPQYRYAWWKKCITQIQLVQFFLIAMHNTAILFMSRETCSTSRAQAVLLAVQTSVITLFFADFYYKEYIKPKRK
uniref:Elongation of very long chain fatty acids protein n=1 Tax=Blattella germanica TaxID=6973 RepID=A0A8F7GPG0_BLAGE|nr:fatty acid elongase 14 [Blattella germanica]